MGGRGADAPGVGRPLEMNFVGAGSSPLAPAPETSACGFNVSEPVPASEPAVEVPELDTPSDTDVVGEAAGAPDGGVTSETLELATVSEVTSAGGTAPASSPSTFGSASTFGAAAFFAAAFFAGAFFAGAFSPSAVSASAFGAAAFLVAAFFAAAFFTGFSSSGCASRFSPSRSALRRTRSACASSIEEETLRTSMPIDFERSRASLFVRPSSFASSAILIFLAGKG